MNGRAAGRSADVRRLIQCLTIGLVLAVMTGPSGSNAAPTSGLHHSLFAPRVVVFLIIGVVLWAVGTASSRTARTTQRLGESLSAISSRTLGRRSVRYPGYGAVLIVLMVLPFVLSDAYQSALIDFTGLYIVLALGLNVVVGFAGLLDLGFIAFFAVGAYGTAYFTDALPAKPPFVVTPFLCFPIAIALAMAAGVVLGAPTLRLRGDYLAIVTLGFGEIIFDVADFSNGITGGGNGVGSGARSGGRQTVPHFVFGSYHWTISERPYWFLLLGMLVLVVILLIRLENSRVGRAWVAIREDEVAAEASGINALKYKVLAFAIGASTSGFAGTFYASRQGFFDPNKFLEQVSILILVLVIFGGMGSIWGTIAGTILVQGFQAYLNVAKPSWYQPQDLYIYVGFLLIVMMIFRPQGLVPSRRRARELRLAEQGVGSADALAAPGMAP